MSCKKGLLWLLTLAMVCSLLMGQFLGDPGDPQKAVLPASLHENAEQIEHQVSYVSQQLLADATYGTEEAAVAQLRQQMVERNSSITVSVTAENTTPEELAEQIFNAAMAHTGVPTEGDYLKWHIGSWKAAINYTPGETITNATITYTISYYTTAEQEAEITSKIQSVLDAMDLYEASEYEKICGIYDYICRNVTYDFQHLSQGIGYPLMFTAYAAMVNGTAVCQGYASLLYRMALTLGVEARLVGGESNNEPHAWNIVRIGSVYYDVDATWDAMCVEEGQPCQYFLRCDQNFANHSRFMQYDNKAFRDLHPMSQTDFESKLVADQNQCGENLFWSWDFAGTLTISGTGEFYDYESAEQLPWYPYRERILNLSIGENVTGIDDLVLDGCNNLSVVRLPSSLVSIADSAFADCAALWHVLYMGTEEQWNTIAIGTGNDNLQNAMRHFGCKGNETMDVVNQVCQICVANCTHQWEVTEVTKEPTCATYGRAIYTCTLCRKSEKRSVEPPGHQWVEATCTTPKTCEVCHQTRGQTIDHDWQDATCTAPQTCNDCGATQGEALEHPWQDATCTAPKTCGVCGQTDGDPIAHAYGQWEIVKEATTGENGEKRRVCGSCGEEEREPIPALEPAPTEPIPSQTEPTNPPAVSSSGSPEPTQSGTPQVNQNEDTENQNSVVVIAGVAVLGVAAIAGVVLLLRKKK